jgi:hypothetical protein
MDHFLKGGSASDPVSDPEWVGKKMPVFLFGENFQVRVVLIKQEISGSREFCHCLPYQALPQQLGGIDHFPLEREIQFLLQAHDRRTAPDEGEVAGVAQTKDLVGVYEMAGCYPGKGRNAHAQERSPQGTKEFSGIP